MAGVLASGSGAGTALGAAAVATDACDAFDVSRGTTPGGAEGAAGEACAGTFSGKVVGVPSSDTSAEGSFSGDSAGVEPHPSFFLMKLNMA